MTKEELYKEFYDWDAEEEIIGYLDSFFNDKVVIPKGENRHPYADVLHKWVEDTTNIIQSKEYYFDEGKYYWNTCGINYAVQTITTELRIKPSDPANIQFYDDKISTETWFKASDYCKENNLCPFDHASWSKAVEAVSKPQEPVYEWQWYRLLNGKVLLWDESCSDRHSKWATEDEIAKTHYTSWRKFEETKRERK